MEYRRTMVVGIISSSGNFLGICFSITGGLTTSHPPRGRYAGGGYHADLGTVEGGSYVGFFLCLVLNCSCLEVVLGLTMMTDSAFPKLDEKSLLDYLRKNLAGHIEDAQNVLKKPLILGEFGKPSDAPGYTQAQRDAVFTTAFDIIYVSAQKGGAAAGALFWHLISDDMNNFRDAYSISLSEKSSTINIIGQQSRKMNLIGGKGKPGGYGGDAPSTGGRGGRDGSYDGDSAPRRQEPSYGDAPAEKVKQCDENCDNATIYINNLPPDVITDELKDLFGGIGQVGRIKQKRGYKDQRPYNIKIYTVEKGKNKGDACLAYEPITFGRRLFQQYDIHRNAFIRLGGTLALS
ncbi:hypothetical protein F2Q68_00002810 [Brassica cretica]|uniref:RRM domain-containing protein n=1 Tax=Brassica cretica TaxID=69181 RepID=A0A8S9JFE5_BRACR|nr:hypothetical protein F2Q68_00002810 [Brassica cretica]